MDWQEAVALGIVALILVRWGWRFVRRGPTWRCGNGCCGLAAGRRTEDRMVVRGTEVDRAEWEWTDGQSHVRWKVESREPYRSGASSDGSQQPGE